MPRAGLLESNLPNIWAVQPATLIVHNLSVLCSGSAVQLSSSKKRHPLYNSHSSHSSHSRRHSSSSSNSLWDKGTLP